MLTRKLPGLAAVLVPLALAAPTVASADTTPAAPAAHGELLRLVRPKVDPLVVNVSTTAISLPPITWTVPPIAWTLPTGQLLGQVVTTSS